MFELTLPSILFGSIIAWLIGATIHLIAGGKLIRLIFSMLFAWIGFWVGNYFSNKFGIYIFKYGQIIYGPAIISCVIISIFGYWLSGENKADE